jgi:hexosaminidase
MRNGHRPGGATVALTAASLVAAAPLRGATLVLMTVLGGGLSCAHTSPPETSPVSATSLHIIPRPASVAPGAGRFVLSENTRVHGRGDFAPVAAMASQYLRPATGYSLPVVDNDREARDAITIRHDASLAGSLGSEGYRLLVTPRSVVITAAAPEGAFHGIQSLRQLLPPQIFREAVVSGVPWVVPALVMEDTPRFRWRGSHLDVSRHFMPMEFVKKFIDLLALHKMNSFHWHLTDDQGWRIQIRKYPRLTEVGAWRKQTLIGNMRRNLQNAEYDGKPHGGFYTQDDVREIVAYAAARFINVVPEIEMPGHAQAVIAAYPQMGSTTDSVAVREVWGVSQHLLSPADSTINFMKDVLSEVLELFPSSFIHIGGDEAVKNEWRASRIAQARMAEKGLASEEELQSWFIHQFDEFLSDRGRRLVGWDEILEGGLAPNAVVMSWRGTNGGLAAARDGHDVIMTPTSHTYFDYLQSRSPDEPLAIGGFLPLDTVYAYEPVPADLEPEFVKHILGAQAQLWTEYMPNPRHVEYMAFPRLSALAEVVWTPREQRDFADFSRRLDRHLQRMDILDVNYRRPR